MYDVGDVVISTFTVTDPESRVKRSAAVTVTLTDPDGEITHLEAAEVSSGEYLTRFVPQSAGRYVIRWQAIDPAAGQIAGHTDVINVSEISSASIISLDEARQFLNIPSGEHVDDEELRGHIAAATAAVERHLGQVVVPRTVVDYITVDPPSCRLWLPHTPVITVTSIASLDGELTWDPSVMVLDPHTGMLDNTPGDPFCGRLKVTYRAGYREVPANIILATQIIVGHLWQTQRVSSVGQPPAFAPGGETVSATTPGLAFALPNRALELLGGRPPVIA